MARPSALARHPSRAETTAADAEIVLCGTRRVVKVLHLAEFSAFEARHQDALVTVIARHMGSEFPEIVRLTDLEPMLSALEHLDRATAGQRWLKSDASK